MSNTCGSCDCADQSQCKKGNSYAIDIVETEQSFVSAVVMEAPAPAENPAPSENDGKCKCGSNCSCTDCSCGSH